MNSRFIASPLLLSVLLVILVLSPVFIRITSFTAQESKKNPQQQRSVKADAQMVDDLFLQVSRTNPGFGGMFLDEKKQVLYVYSKDPARESLTSLRRGLETVMGPEFMPQVRIKILPAKYSFVDLKKWQKDITVEILAIPGVVLVDADEAKNRVTIGVEKRVIRRTIENRLTKLGIPLAAVNIQVMQPIKMDTSLQDRHRPLVGGLQISRGGFCTLGFPAVRQGVVGFVTNSHCTAIQGGVEGSIFDQALTSGTTNQVGVEIADPVYVGGGNCPDNRVCRSSDAAFVQLTNIFGAELAHIARPPLNSTAWNGADRFVIVREGSAIVGMTVTKVGRTTGRTEGKITKTCADINIDMTNFTHLCQNQADYNVASGDSGSPVFRIWNPPNDREVVLLGIHSSSSPDTGSFSPFVNIAAASELGHFECIARRLCGNNQRCCETDLCGGCTICVPLNAACP